MKKYIVLIVILLNSIISLAQERKLPEGWDVILLEGKTAYMNLVTGDVSTNFPTKPALKPVKVQEYDPTILHKVEKGETLSSIARKYNMNLAELYRLNSITNFDKIEIGDEIVIGYKDKNDVNSPKLGTKIYKSYDDFHTVKSGETLYRISVNNGISVNKLKQLNNLKSNNIFVGQKLRLK